ncbi:MAG TPA: polysaccharide deacetylase family protein [Thermoanaerobaculia bacterium]|nr:polysaccharide deacetylase family protein [Thermoanaerobaculia bacterium]
MSLPYEIEIASGLPRGKELAKTLISWSALPLGSVIRVATREPAIALTFDDGPHPEDTPRVLEALERHGARGTFFMVGKSAHRYPEVVARAAAAGHTVANHSWDHPSFRRIDGRYRRAQIRWCAEALAPHGAKLFRPPFGEQSVASRLDALGSGHRVIWGDVIAEDWRDDPADVLVQRVMRRLRRGSIALFHDTLYTTTDERFRDRGPLLAALDTLLGKLSGEYRFVTVPELLALGRPVRWHHYYRLPVDFHRGLVP